MKIHWLALALVTALAVVIDLWLCRWLHRHGHRRLAWFNGGLAVLLVAIVVALAVMPLSRASTPNSVMVVGQYLLYAYFTILVPKLLGLLLGGVLRWLAPNARRVAAGGGVALALLVFAIMWWGALVTPRTLEVREVELAFERLPAAFDGYRIVHWSDAHLGTYNGKRDIVERYVRQINALHPDMICFTGDLVSRITAEALPYRDLLATLYAPDGVYSVLGNHDYDDYSTWESKQAMLDDRHQLCQLQTEMGWRLLNNDHAIVQRGGDQIVVIGTENFGDHPYDKHGDLAKAYGGLRDSHFKVQLQHNPWAWQANTLPNSNIDLTLSGHTHAWQVMLKVGDWRWSPASVRYRQWGGAYHQGAQWLYVNIGVGMVGPPMRIGATPEITVITLRAKEPTTPHSN